MNLKTFIKIQLFLWLVYSFGVFSYGENDSSDSPFGIFGPYEFQLDSPEAATRDEVNEYLKDLGVKWVEEMYINSGIDDIPQEINCYSRAGREAGNKPPHTTKEYKQALRKIIRRYKNRVKYWEVGTEPNGMPPPFGWKGFAKEYAAHLKETYQIIKQECPECSVVFGGLSGVGRGKDAQAEEFLKEVIDINKGKYFDVFEFKLHHHKQKDYPELKDKMQRFGKILADYELDIKKIPVFVETAMYDGDPYYPEGNPLYRIDLPFQTEAQQAAALVKTYVFGLAQGIDKIFWNLIIERHNFGNNPGNPFNFYGLVNNPENENRSHKKLAYYTYKKMVEILEGSNWDNIQTIKEEDGMYVYKFAKQGKHIWVAWNDNVEDKEFDIWGIASSTVKITNSVPNYKTGREILDYNSVFKVELKNVFDGNVSLTLTDTPIFAEEKESDEAKPR